MRIADDVAHHGDVMDRLRRVEALNGAPDLPE